MLDRLHEFIRRARSGDYCMTCGQRVNPLLHIAEPWRCKSFHFGGKPEPHKDDL